jgi:hypothetical protein
MYTHIHTYLDIYMHTLICTYTYVYDIYIYIYIYVYIRIHLYVHTHTLILIHAFIILYAHIYIYVTRQSDVPCPRNIYGVAMISTLLKIIGLFCKIAQ